MVFESLLERVLLSSAGKFVTGIDKKNLKVGIWSGNVVIENVGLAKNLVEVLELPVNIEFSSIGKLSLQVPWNKLASSPVEVLLENVFLLVTPMREKDWASKDYDNFELKAE